MFAVTELQPMRRPLVAGLIKAIVVGSAAAALASGCASLPEPHRANLASESSTVQGCAAWFQALDQAIDEDGVRDAGDYRVPGYPYLRVDRFLASFRAKAETDGNGFAAWFGHMRERDATARRYELRNLAAARLTALGISGREQASARTEECAGQLAHRDLASPLARKRLAERAVVPDDYSNWQRALGLYGLARIPFARGVERWHDEALALFREPRDGGSPSRTFWRYGPSGTARVARQASAILAGVQLDPLGIPALSRADRDRLLAAYAPVFEIETTGSFDRFGPIAWGRSPSPEVDPSRPTVYGRLAHTRYGDRTLVQLVYSIWFPERPQDGPFDLLAGKLDGVVLRVTLSQDGEPLVYDSIHPCGCFHMFFPTPLAQPRQRPEGDDEWAFIPATVPAPGSGQRIAVRIASRSHYLLAIAPVSEQPTDRTYDIADEDELRSLPAGDGAWRSAFGPDGLVPGTERAERVLFWPMGIASAGAMRQWGKHATAFLGRRHFDDANLLEQRFRILPR